MKNNKLKYFWLKEEANRKVKIIIEIKDEFLNKDADIFFEDKRLKLYIEKKIFESDYFPAHVEAEICENNSKIFLMKKDGNLIMSFDFEATKRKNKM